jgi:hypothetical protein
VQRLAHSFQKASVRASAILASSGAGGRWLDRAQLATNVTCSPFLIVNSADTVFDVVLTGIDERR